MPRGRRTRNALLLLLAALALVVAGILLFARDDARAWRQAIVVGGIARGTDDAAAGAARRLGGDVRGIERLDVGGLPATLVAPRGSGRVPAVVVLVPAGTRAEEERRIVDLQRGLAAAGLAGWAVRVPAEDDLLARPGAAIRAALADVASHARTRARAVSALASGPAASIVLATPPAGVEDVDLRAVVAVEPVSDLRAHARDALVGAAGMDPELRARIGRLLARAARDELEASGATVAAAIVDRALDADDPVTALRGLPRQAAVGRLARIADVLRARDVPEFDRAWRDLPADLRARVAAVSPLPVADSIDARVLVVDLVGTGPDELGDGRALVAALPDARRLAVPADGDLPPTRELLSVSAWWLRRAGA